MTDTRTSERPRAKKPLRQIDAKLRKRIERVVEKLIAALDAAEPDPDLEPTFGHLPPGGIDEAEGPDVELEPSLGFLEGTIQSTSIINSGLDGDREDEHDGREPDDDLENSLGWTEAGVMAQPTTYFVNDGEQGDLSVRELDALRAERRARRAAEKRAVDGSDGVLVIVRDGKVVGRAKDPWP